MQPLKPFLARVGFNDAGEHPQGFIVSYSSVYSNHVVCHKTNPSRSIQVSTPKELFEACVSLAREDAARERGAGIAQRLLQTLGIAP